MKEKRTYTWCVIEIIVFIVIISFDVVEVERTNLSAGSVRFDEDSYYIIFLCSFIPCVNQPKKNILFCFGMIMRHHFTYDMYVAYL